VRHSSPLAIVSKRSVARFVAAAAEMAAAAAAAEAVAEEGSPRVGLSLRLKRDLSRIGRGCGVSLYSVYL